MSHASSLEVGEQTKKNIHWDETLCINTISFILVIHELEPAVKKEQLISNQGVHSRHPTGFLTSTAKRHQKAESQETSF